VPAGCTLQLGLEARLAARVRRSPEEFHAAAEAAERLWGRADWQPQSRCITPLLERSSIQLPHPVLWQQGRAAKGHPQPAASHGQAHSDHHGSLLAAVLSQSRPRSGIAVVVRSTLLLRLLQGGAHAARVISAGASGCRVPPDIRASSAVRQRDVQAHG
jgi:hypothetical protein